MRPAWIVSATVLVLVVAGCGPAAPRPEQDYKTVASDRDTEAARQHNLLAVEWIQKGNLGAAEGELKAALAADMLFGPAHNNLGTIYFRQRKYYLSAWEFQYAAKLMSDKAEPRNNLGLVFETVGRFEDAAKAYEEALQVEPQATEPAANLARLYVRTGRADERTRQLLTDVVMKDPRPAWAQWARERLAQMGRPLATGPAAPQ